MCLLCQQNGKIYDMIIVVWQTEHLLVGPVNLRLLAEINGFHDVIAPWDAR